MADGLDGLRGADRSRLLAVTAARAADAKSAADTVVIDVGDVLGITDHFVITSGNNDRQVRTIAEEVEQRIKGLGGPGPLRIEGLADASWVLMDYGDVVIHVFHTDARQFYDLERLWRDLPRVAWQDETPGRGAAAGGE